MQQQHLSNPSSPRESAFDINTLTLLLERKRDEPTWSINSRESTPAVFFDPKSVSGLDFWRRTALLFEESIRSIDERTDYRRTIQTSSYWEIEAKHLEKEYWALQGLRGKKRTENQSKPISSSLEHDSQDKMGLGAQDGSLSARSSHRQGKIRIEKPKKAIPSQSKRRQGNISTKKQDGPISSRLRNRKSTSAYSEQNAGVTRRARQERSIAEKRTQKRRRRGSDE